MSRKPPRAVRRAGVVGVLLAPVLLAACGPTPQSAVAPVSDFAWRLQDLFEQIFWWGLGVFVVVEGLLLYALFRYRERPGNEEARQFHGHTLLEIGWTLAPAVILVFIAVPTVSTIFDVDRRPEGGEEPLKVEVTAYQWWWDFEYPELGVRTSNEVHVPVGRTVELEMTSADVIHSFWVPRVGGKRDVMPGRRTYLWFSVDSAGVYEGQCAEFCGTSHALMRMRLVAQEPQEFREWAERQRQPATEPTDSLAATGMRTFMRVCVACHAVEGTRAQARIGPDLTHAASRRTVAGGIMENTPENLRRWLEDPQGVKPGNKMRIPPLSDEQIEALVAYLETLE